MSSGMSNNGTKLVPVMIALLLGVFIASLDNTIVATAMGTIVAELGGFDKFVWVSSAYLAMEMAGMPVFGKLSDMYGRKRFFILGIALFIVGSILCGTAQSIVQLSLYRAIQGVGASAIMPIAFTIVWDVFPTHQRGKVSGVFGIVFGLSSILGPLLGAYITENFGWRWAFYINIPLGIAVLLLIVLFYRESSQHKKQNIDWRGAITLVGAIVSLMFALELGGQQYDWNSGVIIALLASFAVLLFVFIIAETKAVDPIISFEMFKRRLFTASNLVGMFYGATFMVATLYIPIFIQGVTGGSAINSGLLLLPMMLGTSVTAALGGQLSTKFSYRTVMIISAVIFIAGMLMLSTLSQNTSRWQIFLYMTIVGLGTGASFSVLGMAAIHHFESHQRGSATSTNSFLRSLGMTVGITVFGVIQRNVFSHKLAEDFSGQGQISADLSFKDPHTILSPVTRAAIPEPALEKITIALSSSISQTFLWALIPAALTFVFILMIGKEKLDVAKEENHTPSYN